MSQLKIYDIVDKIRELVNTIDIKDIAQYIYDVCQDTRKSEYCKVLTMLFNLVMRAPEGLPKEVWTKFLKWAIVLLAISDRLLWSADIRDWAEGQVYCAGLDATQAVLLPAVSTNDQKHHEMLKDMVEHLLKLAVGTVSETVRMLSHKLQ